MDHPRACGGCGLRYRLRALGLHGVKALGTALGENTDQIDGDVRIAHRGLDGGRVTQIGLDRMDLADPAGRLEMARQCRPADGDPHAIATLAQRADHVSAQKTRAAEKP